MAYNLKITVFNNRDYEQSFTLNDSEGQPLNLSGYKLLFSIGTSKPLVFDSSVLTNKCISVTNAAEGSIKLNLPYSVLKTIAAGTYNHELILVDVASVRSGIWSGTLTVKKGVST